MKYRKKPIIIEAVKVSIILEKAHNSNCVDQPLWIQEAVDKNTIEFASDCLYIKTLEGTMKADPDDMLICGVNGELYPCKPNIFEKTYEKI